MCSQKVCYTSQPTDLEGDGVVRRETQPRKSYPRPSQGVGKPSISFRLPNRRALAEPVF